MFSHSTSVLTSRNVWKIFINSPCTLAFCLLQKMTCLDWTIYSWQGLNSLGCLLMLRTNYWCVQVTQHQCRHRRICVESVHIIHLVHSLFVCYKNDLSWVNNQFMAWFQLIRMSSYVKNKLNMCSVTQHQCRRRQMCRKVFTNSPSTVTFCLLGKSDLSCLNNLFTARFQLSRMSSYAKNKL